MGRGGVSGFLESVACPGRGGGVVNPTVREHLRSGKQNFLRGRTATNDLKAVVEVHREYSVLCGSGRLRRMTVGDCRDNWLAHLPGPPAISRRVTHRCCTSPDAQGASIRSTSELRPTPTGTATGPGAPAAVEAQRRIPAQGLLTLGRRFSCGHGNWRLLQTRIQFSEEKSSPQERS